MPAILTAGNKLKVTYACRSQGQNGLITIKYNVVSVAGMNMTDQKLVDGLSTTWAGLLQPFMSAGSLYYGAKLDHLDVLPAAPVFSQLGQGNGTAGGNDLPAQVAAVITKRTAKAGRRWRGRCYIPFISDAHMAGNGLPNVPTINPLMTAVGAELKQDRTVTSGLDSAVIRSIITNSTIPVGLFEPVTSCDNRSAFGTQRRRSKINKGDAFPF